MTRNKRPALIGLGVTILVCAVIVAALAWRRSRVPDLMTHATRLMPMGTARCALPYWDDTGACLSTATTPTGLPMISRIDYVHKSITILSDLNLKISRLYSHRARLGTYNVDNLPDPDSISLDDQWVWVGPFIGPSAASDLQTYALSAIDNRAYHVAITDPFDPVVFWMPDRRHWVEEDRQTQWILHSIRDQREGRPLPLMIYETTAASVRTFKGNEVMCVRPNGHLLTLLCKDYGMNRSAYVWDIQVTNHRVEAHSAGVVSVPQRVLATDFAVSPDGEFLVWWYLYRDRYLATDPQGETQVWISKIDGSNRREIYCEPGSYDGEIDQFRWTPDGKRLTFSKDYVLYIIPVPAPSP